MPAIRDWTYVYNITNSTSIVAPLPWVESGDLLLALVSADTGSQTWSSSGWTQLFSHTNGNNIAVLWKIAGLAKLIQHLHITYQKQQTAIYCQSVMSILLHHSMVLVV